MINVNAETVKVLEATPAVVRALLGHLDAQAWRTRPSDGEWSPLEIAVHLADVERHTVERVRRVLTEDCPVLPAWDHEALPARAYRDDADPNAALRDHVALRQEHLELLGGLDEQQWQRQAHLETHGRLTLSALETHVAAEEVDHLAQLARQL